MKSPNQQGKGFYWAVIAVIVVAVVVIGFIVWNGKSSSDAAADAEYTREEISAEVTLVDDGTAIELKSASATESTPVADLYEDLSCHVCSSLNDADHDAVKEKVESGELIVHFHPLNFLNEGWNNGSNLGGNAVLAAAKSGDASLFWSLRSYILTNFRSVSGTWANEDYANAAEAMGAEDDVVDTIADGAEEENFVAMADANSEKLEALLGSVSSPHVFVGDEQLELNSEDMADWADRAVATADSDS